MSLTLSGRCLIAGNREVTPYNLGLVIILGCLNVLDYV